MAGHRMVGVGVGEIRLTGAACPLEAGDMGRVTVSRL